MATKQKRPRTRVSAAKRAATKAAIKIAKTPRAEAIPPPHLKSADKTTEYAKNVVAGKVLANRYVVLACQRHLNDLKRSKTDEFPYEFHPEIAERKFQLIEALPHTKGEWAERGEKIKLEPFQHFIVGSLFGWIDKKSWAKDSFIKYRFREAYIEIPRKNGKSILAAAIAHLKFWDDGEFGAEVYSGATSEKQAWEVFRPALEMAKMTPDLCDAHDIQCHAKKMTIEKNGSRFEPIIGKPGDGASPHCAVIDEYHEHQTDHMCDTMRTGMRARRNPLLFKITTAGSDRGSPCWFQHCEVIKLLEGQYTDERLFGIIFTIDADEDWTKPEALRKANPNFGISIEPEGLEHDQKLAVQNARLQNAFLTKNLNLWVNADVAWMNMAAWKKCEDKHMRLAEFEGQECDIGLDLASRVDLASKVRLFRRMLEGKLHFYAFATHYLNEQRVKEEPSGRYAAWARDAKLTVTPGAVTDYGWVMNDVVADMKRFVVRELRHDPWQSEPLLQIAQVREDWNRNTLLVAVDQNTGNMSPAMKELEAVVLDGRFHHDGDPMLEWMIANVVCHTDRKDNIFPAKLRAENKIDGAVATMLAISGMMARPMTDGTRPSIFDRGSIFGDRS